MGPCKHNEPPTEGSTLPDIGWTTATMRLRIADATPTAATNEIASGYGGQRDGRHGIPLQ